MANFKIKSPWNGRNFCDEVRFKKGNQVGKKTHFISKQDVLEHPELQERFDRQMEWSRKGHEAKRQRRQKMAERQKFRDTFNDMLSTDYETLEEWISYDFMKPNLVSPDKAMAWFKERGRNLTVQDAICFATLKNAIIKGDTRCIEFIRDTIGEKPKVEVETNANIQSAQGFTDLAKMLYPDKDTEKKEEQKED